MVRYRPVKLIKAPFNINLTSRLSGSEISSSLFAPLFPGLPDVAGLAGAGDQTRGAVHNPRERRQPLADVRPATQSALPASPRASSPGVGLRWRERGFRYARPHGEGQHPLTTDGQDSPGRATEASLQISSCEGVGVGGSVLLFGFIHAQFASLSRLSLQTAGLQSFFSSCYPSAVTDSLSSFEVLNSFCWGNCPGSIANSGFWHWPGESLQIKAGVKF